MNQMPGSSTCRDQKSRKARAREELWRRVGEFVRTRREQLSLSQSAIIRVLGYRSRNAVSNIEVGVEGLPAKRAYAWADILEIDHDKFFRFVTGEIVRMDTNETSSVLGGAERLTSVEKALLGEYRSLPPKFQRRLRDQATEFRTLAQASSPTGER